jgi:heme-degrading monooxygenase HmoA
MLTLPWTTTGSAPLVDQPTVLAGRLPFRSLRQLLPAVWWAHRIRGQLAHTRGLAGHSLAIDFRNRTVWTVSVWTSRTSLNEFDHSAVHQGAKAGLRSQMLPSTFVMWTHPGSEIPVSWPEIRARIAGATRPAS